MILADWLAYIGVALGVVVMFLAPWLKKNADLVAAGQVPVRFASNYVYAFVLSFITVMLTVAAVIAGYQTQGDVGLFVAFWGGLMYGALNAYVVKLPFDWLESRAKMQVVVPPPSG